jgi:hypothetical protein
MRGGLCPTGIPLRGLARVAQARFGTHSLRDALASGRTRFGTGSRRVMMALWERSRQPSVSIEWV